MQTMTPTAPSVRRMPARGRTEQLPLTQVVKTVSEETQQTKKAAFEQIKIGVEFKLSANGAKSVAVAGSFNNWNAKKTPMKKSGDVWQAKVELPRGRYEYRFVVDGQWVSDPNAKESAPNPFGSSNSVLSL
jgi:1,4-alpha-glucan branching enzyme